MRKLVGAVLLLGTGTWAGCGPDEPPALAPPAAAPTASAPVAHALHRWRTARPQHLSVSIVHVVQTHMRYWTGDPHDWARSAPRLPEPLAAQAWVGAQDQALLAPGPDSPLAFHHSVGAPLVQMGVATPAPRSALRRDGLRVELPGYDDPLIGWSSERPPDPAMLGNDLVALLDLRALADWLTAVARWSEWSPDGGGIKRTAMAKAPRSAPWGAVTQIDVALVLDRQAELASLTVSVRREPESEPRFGVRADTVRGDGLRWAKAFPLAPLRHPDEVLGPSLPKGHPDLSDAAHETTIYVLRPAPGPISADLEQFLSARRVVR